MLEIQICESLGNGIRQILLDGKPVQQHFRRVVLTFEKSQRPVVTLEPCLGCDHTEMNLEINTWYDATLTVVP